jgi:hypothetical protein
LIVQRDHRSARCWPALGRTDPVIGQLAYDFDLADNSSPMSASKAAGSTICSRSVHLRLGKDRKEERSAHDPANVLADDLTRLTDVYEQIANKSLLLLLIHAHGHAFV